MVAKAPDVFANFPLSPLLYSTLQIRVPSGINPTGSIFPIFIVAFLPQ